MRPILATLLAITIVGCSPVAPTAKSAPNKGLSFGATFSYSLTAKDPVVRKAMSDYMSNLQNRFTAIWISLSAPTNTSAEIVLYVKENGEIDSIAPSFPDTATEYELRLIQAIKSIAPFPVFPQSETTYPLKLRVLFSHT
jgi:hypothetical protein